MINKFKRFFLTLLRMVTNDEFYCRIRYFIKFRRTLDLKNPDTFNAKINWLKLYDRKPQYSVLADKYSVRSFVKEKIGEQHLIKILGVYETVDEINFNELPNRFVLKATHGSGWIIICTDKAKFNVSKAKRKMKRWLCTNFYALWGESIYKDIPPRIICEEYLANENEASLIDYKFYCFNGIPKYLYVVLDRCKRSRINFYDFNWNRLPFGQISPQADRNIPRPKSLEKLIEVAGILSQGLKLVRVDLYEVKGHVYFGELTMYPNNGLSPFDPPSMDYELGNLITI